MKMKKLVIYDYIIKFAYFSATSVISVANTLFEKTKPINLVHSSWFMVHSKGEGRLFEKTKPILNGAKWT